MVSGRVEPDTIVVNTEDLVHLVVESTVIGNKDRRMVVTGKVGTRESPTVWCPSHCSEHHGFVQLFSF